ncbi:hypothetical protein EW146_g8897 [Bondarzewia mesenterica]|uniref:Uncharacterized protein n=1 Tax=Bondarzewia mesenterica TaxID=1095465 RepID=A0A4S4LAQ9_9AGAM|nr:hypothetical protein EW146_g8897 [Bondarzewia mesenterica]
MQAQVIKCSVFVSSHFFCYDVFTLFVSTNPRVSRRLPAKEYIPPSSHVLDVADFRLQAPITELPFDCWRIKSGEDVLLEDEKTLDDICEPRFMAQFGRPLFGAWFEKGLETDQFSIFDFAVMKIAGEPIDEMSTQGDLAALGIRILFDFEPSRTAAVELENELVERHMRMVFSIPAHGDYIRAGAPSEPILAEAAARIMNGTRNRNKGKNWLRQLPTYLDLFRKGDMSSLVMRTMLTFAHDRAIMDMAGHEYLDHITWSQAIPVETFLKAWFGVENAESILASKPDNVPDEKTLGEAFKGASVYFTQFVRAEGAKMVSDETAWAGAARGMAYSYSPLESAIDIMIPIVLQRDGKLNRFNSTCLLIQIKDSNERWRPRVDAERLGFFTHSKSGQSQSRPYIAIVVQLGAQVSKETKGMTGSQNFALSSQISKTHEKPFTNPRYAFDIIGCSSRVFGIMSPLDEDWWARLLQPQDYLWEHDRRSNEARRAVMRQKPIWQAQADSFDWIKPADAQGKSEYPSSSLFPGASPEEPVETIKIHRYSGDPLDVFCDKRTGMDEEEEE